MKTATELILDQDKLNVTNKKRANLFNWRGQFTPEFIEYLIKIFAKPGDTIFDPFCGSGTVLLEAARYSFSSIGFEINPAAYAMARFISLATLSEVERRNLSDSLKKRIEALIEPYNDLPLFESKKTFRQSYNNLIHFAKDLMSNINNKNEKVLALACLFHAENYRKDSLSVAVLHSFEVVTEKLYSLPYTKKSINVNLCDARMSHKIIQRPVDLIITSPPYINVFNYHQNYRSIMELLGFNILKIAESEIGSNRKNRGNRFKTVVQYALDMEEALKSFAISLKNNGIIVLVVGRESRIRGIPFCNSSLLLQIAEAMGGYRIIATPERVFTNRFGMDIKEDILVLEVYGVPSEKANARDIAKQHLISALHKAQGEIADDINNALNQIDTIKPSPVFNKKDIYL